jgi:type II secretory pathway component GspD/PulD (secretin)
MKPRYAPVLRAAAPLLLAFALIGCDGTLERSEDATASAEARSGQLNTQFYSREAVRAGGVQSSSARFVAPEIIELKASDRLPPSAETSTSVVLISREPLRLQDIAARLSDITKIQHSLQLGPDGQAALSAVEGGRATEGAGTSRAGTLAIRPNLRGKLSTVLDQVASAFDVEWTYTDGRVVFRDFVTRQYQLSALPVVSSMSSGAVETASTASLDIWSELTSGLESIAGPDTRISIGQGTGILTVTAMLPEQERIRDYVVNLNETMGQQIAFDVNVLTIGSRDKEGFGVNIESLAFGPQSSRVQWQGGADLADPVGEVNVGIIDGNFSLSAVITALSTQRDVSVETRAGATTTNFQMIPVEVVEETAYVSEVEVEVDDNGNTTTSLTTDTVTTGFQMQLLPRVLNSGEIMLRYSLNLSDLVAIAEFSSGESTVQLPEVTRSRFEQQVILKNSQTLVLSGFERLRTEVDRQGVGSSRFVGLGGKGEGEQSRASNIVFITPRILSRGNTVN